MQITATGWAEQPVGRAARKILRRVGLVSAGAILVFFGVFPVLWIALISIKTNRQIYQMPPPLLFHPTLANWRAVLVKSDFPKYYLNTLIICGTTVVVVLVVATMGAYALSRYKFAGKDNIAFFILSQRMMPAVVVVLPMYVIFVRARLLDTYQGLILLDVAFSLPMGIWLIRGFLDSVPVELEEAALVDGCSRVSGFFRVVLPMARGGLLATGVLIFIFTVNEFFFAFVLTGTRAVPVSVLATHFLPSGSRQTLYGNAGAAALLIMAPSVLFSTLVQKHLVRGMSLGAIKG